MPDAVEQAGGVPRHARGAGLHRGTTERTATVDVSRVRRVLWRVGMVAFMVQLAGLFIWSQRLFDRFDMPLDFAIFLQPWTLIPHGTLDPFSTIHGYAFVHDHLEVGFWPLSLLSYLDPNGLLLLLLQDLAIVAINVVTFGWILRMLVRRNGVAGGSREQMTSWAVGSLVLVLLLLDPGAYETASDNFHMQAFGTLFLVLTAADLWAGKTRRPVLWAGCALLFGGVFGTCLVAVAVSALLARTRASRTAIAIGVVGALWLAVAMLTHSELGSALDNNYAYLANHPEIPPATTSAILSGLLHHPGRAFHVIAQRWHAVWDQLSFGGVIGLASVWGLPMAVIVLLPAVLNVNPVFVSVIGSFNVVAIYPFLIVGTAEVLARLAGVNMRPAIASSPAITAPDLPIEAETGFRRYRVAVVVSTTIVLTLVLAFFDIASDRQLPAQWELVSVPASQTLSQVLSVTPGDAEVIAAAGVVGRFGGRRSVYAVMVNPQLFPIRARDVEFVLTPSQGIESVSVSGLQADVNYVQNRLHASLLADHNGVYAFSWHPSATTRYVILPGAG
jgi:hypothetical protein